MRTMRFAFVCLALLFCAPLPAAAAPEAEPPLRVAAILATTGIAAFDNQVVLRGLRTAVAEINGEGGVLGRPMILVEMDNRSTPLGSRKAAEAAVRDGALAVIGASWSSHSLAMAPVLQAAAVPMITPNSTHPDVTRAGNYIFRACFTDQFQGKALACFAFHRLASRRVVTLRNVSSHYSMELSDFFRRRFVELGGKVPWEGRYRETSVDFASMLAETARVAPDLVLLPGYSRESGLIIRQAREMGLGLLFLGGDGWGQNLTEFAGQAVVGNYSCVHWHPDLADPAGRRFQDRYQVLHDEAPRDDGAALGYDSVLLLADAIARAGAADHARVRDALAATGGFTGVTGAIRFDENGDPIDKRIIFQRIERGVGRLMAVFDPRNKASIPCGWPSWMIPGAER